MQKVENVKVFPACAPEELEKAYVDWVAAKCEERKKNVAVSSVPFYSEIISRSLLPVGSDKYALAVFYYDYLLAAHEAGPARHHPQEGEGASMIGPDAPKKRR